MSPHDDRIEVPDGWGFVTTDRPARVPEAAPSTGLLVLLAVEPLLGRQEPVRLPTGRQGYPTDLNAYLHIGADGRVTCLVGKVEMGQGAMTSLPQLVAEELDVPLTSVDIVMGDTDLCPWDMGTFGSLSIRQFGPVLRAAAAEAQGRAAAAGLRAAAGAGRRAEGRRRHDRAHATDAHASASPTAS